MPITITEALAELKTLSARKEKKRSNLLPYLARQDGLRDPIKEDGGSEGHIRRELQSISDLETRAIAIRRAIMEANMRETITIGDTTRTIWDWLTWRREIQPAQQAFNTKMQSTLSALRSDAVKKGASVISATASAGGENKPTDFLINIDEAGLLKNIEKMTETVGALDGQLSLKNATVTITV